MKILHRSMKVVNKVSERVKQLLESGILLSTIWFVFVTVFFSNFSKKRQRIASSSWPGISSNFLASLHCTYVQPSFVLLELFWFWFLLPRLASSSSDNVGNLSFSLLLLKSSRKMENFGNLPDQIPPFPNNNATSL